MKTRRRRTDGEKKRTANDGGDQQSNERTVPLGISFKQSARRGTVIIIFFSHNVRQRFLFPPAPTHPPTTRCRCRHRPNHGHGGCALTSGATAT